MASTPNGTPAAKQPVVQPPVRKIATSTSASKPVNTGDVAKQKVAQPPVRQTATSTSAVNAGDVAKQKVAQPPVRQTATSTSASKPINAKDIANQGTNSSKDLVKNETRGNTDTSQPISNKKDTGVEDKDAKKPRGLQVPIKETTNFVELLQLFNTNNANKKPAVHRSRGQITITGGQGNNGKNVQEKKVDNKTPAKGGEKKLPLR